MTGVKWEIMSNGGGREVKELLLRAEDEANRRFFLGTVNVGAKVDVTQKCWRRHHLKIWLAVSNHAVARRYPASACSVRKVKAKTEAANWRTFVLARTWDFCVRKQLQIMRPSASVCCWGCRRGRQMWRLHVYCDSCPLSKSLEQSTLIGKMRGSSVIFAFWVRTANQQFEKYFFAQITLRLSRVASFRNLSLISARFGSMRLSPPHIRKLKR